MPRPEPPDIYAYTAFRRYLADWFKWKKAAHPAFSHRLFAARLGSSDPSVLSNLVKGRRNLSETRIPGFARAMELSEDETSYFTLLVRLGQAGPGEGHEQAWAALMEHRVRRQGPKLDPDQIKVLSKIHFSAIRALAECRGFRADPRWIAQQLALDLDPETVSEALVVLTRLGWLGREATTLAPRTPVMSRAANVAAPAESYGYHRDCQRLVGRVMDELHETSVARSVALFGFTMAVPANRLSDVRRLLWEALHKVLQRAERWTDERDRVVQVSLQLFPLTKPIQDE